MRLTVQEKVSLIVPTMNRPDFLSRLLRYYACAQFRGVLVIGDASHEEHATRALQAIEALKGFPQVAHYRFPGLNEPETTKRLLSKVGTPYVALLPDDDLIVPSSLARCVEFLEDHPDYSLAHGRAVMMMLQGSGPYGRLEAVWPHYWGEEGSNTAAERLLNFLTKNYFTTVFSVHRTQQMQAMYQKMNAAPVLLDKVFMEVLVGCLSVIQGKAKRLDCLYIIRHHHTRRFFADDFYDWLTGPRWFAAYDGFRDCLVEELLQEGAVNLEEAREVVKAAFWPWLASRLMSRWRKREDLDGQRWQGLRKAARRTPGLKNAWRVLRAAAGIDGGVSLPALLHPRSPYYREFTPVYQVLTEGEA